MNVDRSDHCHNRKTLVKWIYRPDAFADALRALHHRAMLPCDPQPISYRLRKPIITGLSFAAACLPSALQAETFDPPASRDVNILLIMIDDLNDWVGFLDGHPDAVTPHMDQLAGESRIFTNAHCPAPSCAPSRAAMLTGRAPSTTGIYRNNQPWPAIIDAGTTLPSAFREAGYQVAGGGKVDHHVMGFNPPEQWDEYFPQVFDDYWTRERFQAERGWLDGEPRERPDWFPLNGLVGEFEPSYPDSFDWGPVDQAESDYRLGDEQMVDWAVEFLERDHDRPFFLAAGIYRPHLPWYAPQRFFDLYDPDALALPPFRTDDLEDVPLEGRRIAAVRGDDFVLVAHAGKYREAVRAYLASVSFVDEQVGRLVDALKRNGLWENTVIILASDHGFHLGEKWHWHKSTLWERTTRVPLLIRVPSMPGPGGSTRRPANLLDLYPTLVELCALPEKDWLDGESLLPQIMDPAAMRHTPAITTYDQHDHSIRTERWRYTRYHEGGEELYDHTHDPNEWHNLAHDPAHRELMDRMAQWLPEDPAPPAPVRDVDLRFDPGTYTWSEIERN